MSSGGGGGTEPDYAYNRRMATLAEEQQGWAKEFMNFYKTGSFEDSSEGGFSSTDANSQLREITKEFGEYPPGTYKDYKGRSWTKKMNGSWIRYDNEKIDNPDPNYFKFKIQSYDPELTMNRSAQELPGGVTQGPGGALRLSDGTPVSYAQLEKMQIADNMRIMPYTTQQAIGESGAALSAANLAKMTTDKSVALVDPTIQAQLNAIKASSSESDRARLESDVYRRTMPEFERMTRTGYNLSHTQGETGIEQSLADRRLINPWETSMRSGYEYATDKAKYMKEGLGLQRPVRQKYFNEVNKGVDVNQRVNQASADVASGFAGAEQRTMRALSPYGINPNSARGRSALSTQGLNYGRALAGARTGARQNAEDETFNRRYQALTMPY